MVWKFEMKEPNIQAIAEVRGTQEGKFQLRYRINARTSAGAKWDQDIRMFEKSSDAMHDFQDRMANLGVGADKVVFEYEP